MIALQRQTVAVVAARCPANPQPACGILQGKFATLSCSDLRTQVLVPSAFTLRLSLFFPSLLVNTFQKY